MALLKGDSQRLSVVVESDGSPHVVERAPARRSADLARSGGFVWFVDIERVLLPAYMATLVMSSELELATHDDPDPALVREIVERLVAANNAVAAPENHRSVAVDVRLEGQLVGGAAGYTHWGWLFVSHLWVAEDRRGHGVGSQLMSAIEQAARGRGAESAHVDTYDFQAVDFYKKAGYRIFGQLDGYPTGHTRFFLQKKI